MRTGVHFLSYGGLELQVSTGKRVQLEVECANADITAIYPAAAAEAWTNSNIIQSKNFQQPHDRPAFSHRQLSSPRRNTSAPSPSTCRPRESPSRRRRRRGAAHLRGTRARPSTPSRPRRTSLSSAASRCLAYVASLFRVRDSLC